MENYKEIPLELIDDPNAPARLNPEDPEIIDLAESIRGVGLINPLRVKKVGDRYEVIAGHRRLMACRMINFSPVPCTLDATKGEQDTEVMLAENVARLNLSPVEEAAMLEELREKKNYGRRTLAKIMGKSEAWVQQRLDLLRLPPDLQKAIHERGLACNTAMILAKVDDEEVREKWIKEILHYGISARTVVLWVNSYEISKQREEYSGDLRELIDEEPERYEPKATCWVCNSKWPYDKIKNILLCPHCYIELLRAISQGERNERVTNIPHSGTGGAGDQDGEETGTDRGQSRGAMQDHEECAIKS